MGRRRGASPLETESPGANKTRASKRTHEVDSSTAIVVIDDLLGHLASCGD